MWKMHQGVLVVLHISRGINAHAPGPHHDKNNRNKSKIQNFLGEGFVLSVSMITSQNVFRDAGMPLRLCLCFSWLRATTGFQIREQALGAKVVQLAGGRVRIRTRFSFLSEVFSSIFHPGALRRCSVVPAGIYLSPHARSSGPNHLTSGLASV